MKPKDTTKITSTHDGRIVYVICPDSHGGNHELWWMDDTHLHARCQGCARYFSRGEIISQIEILRDARNETLRMSLGFVDIDSGSIAIADGRDQSDAVLSGLRVDVGEDGAYPIYAECDLAGHLLRVVIDVEEKQRRDDEAEEAEEE